MNGNSYAIVTLCSHLCVGEGVAPLEPREWSQLAKLLMEKQMQPSELLELSAQDMKERLQLGGDHAQRILRLIGRSASLSFEMSKYENMGIHVVTRADDAYPRKLKKVLGNNCPPIFYYAGDLGLLEQRSVGFVGSRTVSDADEAFTRRIVRKTVEDGSAVVSGGAKGVDSIAETEATGCGGKAIAYLSDSMLRKMRSSATVRAVQDGSLVLLSVVKPDAPFNAGVAMMRNRYIYAQSSGTVIVKADLKKGGTWSGATENLKHGWCPTFCWDRKNYPGNAALIQMGAIPIDEGWNGDVSTAGELTDRFDEEQMTFEV